MLDGSLFDVILWTNCHSSQPEQSFSTRNWIIFLAQFVDVDPVSVLDVEHEVPGVAEHLLALAALQVNFGRLDMGGVLLKACNITSG